VPNKTIRPIAGVDRPFYCKMTSFLRILLIFCLVFAGAVGCLDRRPSGQSLSGDLQWSGRVDIKGDLVIEKGSRLEIAPGTEIVFYPPGENDLYVDHPHFTGSELIVRGTIIAEGTAEQPIIFRSPDPTAPPGSWGGINLVGTNDSSFAYAIFRQADSAIHSQESRVYIEQSIFEENLVAIRFHSSEILIENNLIRNNDTGIRFHFGQPVICKNNIVGNRKGFFVTSHPRNYLIENNTIMENERNVFLGENVPDDFNMPRNYWGATEPVQIRATFFDQQVESYLGQVRILPIRSTPDPASGPQWNR